MHLLRLLEAVPARPDRALQKRRVSVVEFEVVVLEQLARSLCLCSALVAERAVIPSCELVLVVPRRLAVSLVDDKESRCRGGGEKD